MATCRTEIALFMRLEPDVPRLTHQNGVRVSVVNGHAQVYKSPALRALEAKYRALLRPHAPEEPWDCPIGLSTEWVFRRPKGARGMFKTTKPDTDNLVKTLKDVMTACGFWKDDALVCEEVCAKTWAEADGPHGVVVRVRDLSPINGDFA